MSTSQPPARGGQRHRAGLFDIRNIIGVLLLVYGVVLLVLGLVGTGSTGRRSETAANLWMGVALLVVGGLFVLWALLRPIVVPDEPQRGPGNGAPPDEAA